MPFIYVNYPAGGFEPEVLAPMATVLTTTAEELEGIPFEPRKGSTTWVFCRETPRDHVFHGGQWEGSFVFCVQISVLQGGYSATTKTQLIERVTDIVAKFAKLPKGEERRVYVIITEVTEQNWGYDGRPLDLLQLRNPPADAKPVW